MKYRDSDIIGLACGLVIGMFKNSSGGVNMKLKLRNADLGA